MLEMTLAEFWEIMIISHNEDFSLGYELKVIFNQYIFNNIKKLKKFYSHKGRGDIVFAYTVLANLICSLICSLISIDFSSI